MRSKTVDNASVLSVQASDKTLPYWLNQSFISPMLRQELEDVNVLITPRARYGEVEVLHFPQGTEDILQYLRNRQQDNFKVDICIDDKDYSELTLRSDILTLPDIILLYIAAPVFAGLIVEYIKYKLGSRIDRTTIKANITVTDEEAKRSVTLSYDGNANDFEKVVGGTLSLVDSPQSLVRLEETIDLEYEERIRRLSNNTNSGENEEHG